MKYIQFFDKRVIKRKENVPYLVRWTILGFGIDSSWFSIKLHNILISDEECLHNHPWAFISIILKGGYTEHTKALPWSYKLCKWSHPVISDKNGFHVQHKTFKAGNILFRPAHWAHRLELNTGLTTDPKGGHFLSNPIPTWTLVFTFKKVQRWGFFTRNGWIPHWKYSETKDC